MFVDYDVVQVALYCVCACSYGLRVKFFGVYVYKAVHVGAEAYIPVFLKNAEIAFVHAFVESISK